MKQHITKRIIMAVVLSFIMILGIGASVFAETKTIQIKNAIEGNTYSVYQVMTAEATGTAKVGEQNYTTYEYTLNDAFEGFFNGDPYALNGNNEITKNGTVITSDGRNANMNTTEAAALATALARYAKTNNISAVEITSTAATEGLEQGLYVIAETVSGKEGKEVATKPILVNLTDDNATITLKNDTTDLEKKILEGEGANQKKVDSNEVNIGDEVKYEVSTTIPTYEANVNPNSLSFVLKDTFDKGLTYKNNLEIANFEKDTDYSVTIETDENENTVLTITFTTDAIYKNQGNPVVATYSATLNENAKVDSTDGNVNTVTLQYTNNPELDNDYKTLEDETKTYTYGFNLHKVDRVSESEGLANAKFEVYTENSENEDRTPLHFSYDESTKTYTLNENGTYTEIISVGGTGLAAVKGLDEGTYYLKETQAPDQYTKLEDDIVVTITGQKDENNQYTGVGVLTAGGAGNADAEAIGNATTTEVKDATGKVTGHTAISEGANTIDINVYVENAKGISLPETGRNTALYFMIGGVVLVILGAAYYILGARKKAAK